MTQKPEVIPNALLRDVGPTITEADYKLVKETIGDYLRLRDDRMWTFASMIKYLPKQLEWLTSPSPKGLTVYYQKVDSKMYRGRIRSLNQCEFRIMNRYVTWFGTIALGVAKALKGLECPWGQFEEPPDFITRDENPWQFMHESLATAYGSSRIRSAAVDWEKKHVEKKGITNPYLHIWTTCLYRMPGNILLRGNVRVENVLRDDIHG